MRRVYFVGSPAWLRDIGAELARHGDRQLVGYESLGEDAEPLDLERVEAEVLAARATVLVVDIDAVGFPTVVELAETLGLAGIEVSDLVSYYEQEFKKIPLSELASEWLRFEEEPARSRLPRSRAYRAFELALSAAVLLVCLPALVAIGAAIALTSRGPVLYRQRRVGRDGRPFTLLKLRTMTVGAERTASWAPSQAHRVTWLGRPLRRFRVDELPQLWNVLRGDLALVGPRPEQIPIVEMLELRLPHYDVRHCIRPGITGWAQVNVAYGGSVEGALAKLQADLYYVKNASVRLDALIIWLTVKAVLAGAGR
jgi:lipopolysaccharide/colanic/teichoic acid biosynthesis glycosyltransferase